MQILQILQIVIYSFGEYPYCHTPIKEFKQCEKFYCLAIAGCLSLSKKHLILQYVKILLLSTILMGS